MINITRTEIVPESLQSADIQAYIEAITSWKENPIGVKPEPTPAYRNSDVLDAFEDCFYSKCYLTEQRFETPYMMDIEHFYPKNEFPEKRYEWSNLYPAEHNANMAKPNKMPEGGYLDPCNENDDVEKEILYRLDFDAQTTYFEPLNPSNQKAKNTAELLDRIHNGHDKNSREKAKEIKIALFKKRDRINSAIMSLQKAKLNQNQEDEFQFRKKLQTLLSRKSSYTFLMRSTSAVRIHLGVEFFD